MLLASLISLSVANPVLAAETFVVKNIHVDGLERIDVGTVYNEIPVVVGQTFSTDDTATLIRALYKTGFFSDVQVARDGNALVINVVERPSIGKITLSGNKDLNTDDLTKALSDVGIADGRTFDASVLSRVEQELLQQYYARGKYGVIVKTTVKDLERNRVAIDITISEGIAAKIRKISIIGNHAFTQEELEENFTSTTPGWLTWLTNDDQYSKEKLTGDLETLRSHYLDQGYLEFKIDSTQVSITPDKKDIYITINITEGKQYRIKDIKLAGKLILDEKILHPLIKIKPGELFSRRLVTESSTAISDRLGHDSYAFAEVKPLHDVDEQNQLVSLTFFVEPKNRVYVRHVNFEGNENTTEEVLRREMRQMEGAPIQTDKVQRSRTNLMLLGFFSDVTVDTKPVPGKNDVVDVDVKVKEQPSGSINGGIGYSQVDGVMFNAGVRQNNFLGSGKMADFMFNHSSAFTQYRAGYNNPYYTVDGVSRGFDAYYQESDLEKIDITNYTRDAVGGTMTYGIPLSEYDRLNVAFNIENIKLKISHDLATVSDEVLDFINDDGDDFNFYKIRTSWVHNKLDRAVFPREGYVQTLGLEVATPISDFMFYKANSATSWFMPVYNEFILALSGDVAYGSGYGDDSRIPFFENFYAGGIGSVRGFRQNTLGPRDSLGDPLGGNVLITGTSEFIFPTPFISNNSLRTSLFVDAGNVYSTYSDDEGTSSNKSLRFSTGTTIQWMSPIGPFVFSLAKALNAQSEDEEEIFQFTIGTMF